MQDKPVAKKSLLPGGGGAISRLVLVLGGALVLIVLVVVLKNLLLPGPDFKDFVVVAEDQQAMIHLLDNATQKDGLTDNVQDFALTAQLSLNNDQGEVVGYLSKNKQKIAPKVLNMKVSATTDNELGAAASPATYQEVFVKAMKELLTTYQSDLQKTYKNFEGEKGKAILSEAYDNSLLLSQKLETK